MENLFGSESIINELEEDDSEFDEDKYNKDFINDLNKQESKYLQGRFRKDSHSPKGYINKYKHSYTKHQHNTNKPFNEIGKLRSSGSQNLKDFKNKRYSPYTESDKGGKKKFKKGSEKKLQKKSHGIITIMKKKPSVPQVIAASRGSKIPTTATSTNTSSIPSLPPVVKDSWFKDKVARQNLDDIKRRYQNERNI